MSDFVGLAKSDLDGLRKALQLVPGSVRHGSAPEREVQTGIGAVAVQRQGEGRAEPVAGRHLAAGWREDEDRWQRRDLSAACDYPPSRDISFRNALPGSRPSPRILQSDERGLSQPTPSAWVASQGIEPVQALPEIPPVGCRCGPARCIAWHNPGYSPRAP